MLDLELETIGAYPATVFSNLLFFKRMNGIAQFRQLKSRQFSVEDFKSLNKRLHPITDSFPVS
jgi:hypothetical protein